jgi:hypothetical protein
MEGCVTGAVGVSFGPPALLLQTTSTSCTHIHHLLHLVLVAAGCRQAWWLL